MLKKLFVSWVTQLTPNKSYPLKKIIIVLSFSTCRKCFSHKDGTWSDGRLIRHRRMFDVHFVYAQNVKGAWCAMVWCGVVRVLV